MTDRTTTRPTEQVNAQLTLDLKEPVARAYRPSSDPPKQTINFSRVLARITGFSSFTCIGLLVYLLVFTNPAKNTNVLAVLTTIFFGVVFSSWSFEHWFKRAGENEPEKRISTWSITRHSILVAISVLALAGAALNRSASLGLIVLLIFTAVIGNHVLRRVQIR